LRLVQSLVHQVGATVVFNNTGLGLSVLLHLPDRVLN
jgi:hypothetical protein